jgi:hypothetical protein
MRRYLAVSFGGGNRAPRGQDPAQLLLGQKRLDGLSLALAAIHSPLPYLWDDRLARERFTLSGSFYG